MSFLMRTDNNQRCRNCENDGVSAETGGDGKMREEMMQLSSTQMHQGPHVRGAQVHPRKTRGARAECQQLVG